MWLACQVEFIIQISLNIMSSNFVQDLRKCIPTPGKNQYTIQQCLFPASKLQATIFLDTWYYQLIAIQLSSLSSWHVLKFKSKWNSTHDILPCLYKSRIIANRKVSIAAHLLCYWKFTSFGYHPRGHKHTATLIQYHLLLQCKILVQCMVVWI